MGGEVHQGGCPKDKRGQSVHPCSLAADCPSVLPPTAILPFQQQGHLMPVHAVKRPKEQSSLTIQGCEDRPVKSTPAVRACMHFWGPEDRPNPPTTATANTHPCMLPRSLGTALASPLTPPLALMHTTQGPQGQPVDITATVNTTTATQGPKDPPVWPATTTAST